MRNLLLILFLSFAFSYVKSQRTLDDKLVYLTDYNSNSINFFDNDNLRQGRFVYSLNISGDTIKSKLVAYFKNDTLYKDCRVYWSNSVLLSGKYEYIRHTNLGKDIITCVTKKKGVWNYYNQDNELLYYISYYTDKETYFSYDTIFSPNDNIIGYEHRKGRESIEVGLHDNGNIKYYNRSIIKPFHFYQTNTRTYDDKEKLLTEEIHKRNMFTSNKKTTRLEYKKDTIKETRITSLNSNKLKEKWEGYPIKVIVITLTDKSGNLIKKDRYKKEELKLLN